MGNYFEMFRANHNTISVALSLKYDGTDWVEGLQDDPHTERIEFFFEEGTPSEKMIKHIGIAKENELQVKNYHSHVPSEVIQEMIAYTEKCGGKIYVDKD